MKSRKSLSLCTDELVLQYLNMLIWAVEGHAVAQYEKNVNENHDRVSHKT